jgi:hypothetical protein
MPAATVALMPRRALEPAVRCALRRERARAASRAPELVDRIMTPPARDRAEPLGVGAQAAAGAAFDAYDRLGGSRADARLARHARTRRRSAQRDLLASDPGRAARALPGRGPPLLLGAARAFVASSTEFLVSDG